MSHRHSSRHQYNGRTNPNDHRPRLVRAYSSTSSDSLPEVSRNAYYEIVPGTMIDGRRPFVVADGYDSSALHAVAGNEPYIHYDDRRWSKETSRGMQNLDSKQSALVFMAASLFGISVLAGTVLFTYYILSCYGIY